MEGYFALSKIIWCHFGDQKKQFLMVSRTEFSLNKKKNKKTPHGAKPKRPLKHKECPLEGKTTYLWKMSIAPLPAQREAKISAPATL